MIRVLVIVLLLFVSVGCQNVAAPAPTPQPVAYEVTAQMVGLNNLVVTVTNNSGAPLELGGWTMLITPVVSPTLVPAMPFPETFTLANGASFRAHTSGGENTSELLFFDNGGVVPSDAWQQGVKVEMRNPKTDEAITRFIYAIPVSAQ
jgi:hypothetical protein